MQMSETAQERTMLLSPRAQARRQEDRISLPTRRIRPDLGRREESADTGLAKKRIRKAYSVEVVEWIQASVLRYVDTRSRLSYLISRI